MDITDEICFRSDDSNKEVKQKFFLEKMVEDLKLFENNSVEVVQKYSDVLRKDENTIALEDGINCAKVLNEGIQLAANFLSSCHLVSVEHEIFLRLILFLFSLRKIQSLQEENRESNDLRLFIVNTGFKLIKLCIDNDYSLKVEYYINKISIQLNKLEIYYDGTDLSGRNILQHKKAILRLLNIERLLKENKFEEILLQLENTKDCVCELKQYQEYFIALCYNFCLKCKAKENYELVLSSLLVAYDVCKVAEHISSNMKAVIHLLVCTCLKYNPRKNWQHAISALELVSRNSIDIFYIIGMLKVVLISQQQSKVEDILAQAAVFEHINLENISEIVRELVKSQLSSQAAEFIKRVRSRPFSNKEEFLLISLEIQISISQNDENVFRFIENAIDVAKKNDIPSSSIHSLYKTLLAHAQIKLKKNMFEECLMFYSFCDQLSEIGGLDKSLFQDVQMQICLCYIEMEQWNSAKRTFSKLKPDLLVTNSLYVYLALQIAFMYDDEKLAEDILNKYENNEDNIGKILLSCCQKALSSGKKKFLFRILEAMLLKYQIGHGTILSVKLSHSLIILCLESQGSKDIQGKCLLFMDKALDALQTNPQHKDTAEQSNWFSRVTWNLALAPNMDPTYRFEFFLRCCCFSELSTKNVFRLKNSLMMAAAAGLQLVREMDAKEKAMSSGKDSILGKVITVIEKCKTLETGSNMALIRLLYLYEFEAKCHMKEWNDGIEDFKGILHLPFMDIKTLEHIAAIVHEFMPSNYKIIIEALKIATKKITENPQQDSSEASKTYHSLIQVMFYAQEYASSSYEEENLLLCSKLLSLIKNVFDNYPQLEILWLMTKCWNWGMKKLTLHDNRKAYKWCTLAMEFMEKLNSLKTLYEKKLHDMYSTYFAEFKDSKETSEF